MAEQQIIGDQQPLTESVTNPPTHGGPNPNAQLVGDAMPLSRVQTSPPTHGGPPPNAQIVGEQCQLDRTSHMPWEQVRIPRSTLADQPAGNDKNK